LRVIRNAQETSMTIRPFAAKKPDAASVDQAVDELETAKTAALTRMHPSEVADEITEVERSAFQDRRDELASLGTGAGDDFIDFQLRINSIESSLDGGVTTFEGEVQIEEYLNNEFISRITILLSVPGEETTPISEVESRLLEAALERLHAAGSLTTERMQKSLQQTRRDEDVAYSPE
jgi:hypothetical protein